MYIEESTRSKTHSFLNEQFQQVRTNILMMNELPTVQAAYRILVQEERHKDICKVNTANTENMAFVTDKRKPYEHHKISEGQYNYKKPNGGIKRSNNYFYDHCKIRGYSI